MITKRKSLPWSARRMFPSLTGFWKRTGPSWRDSVVSLSFGTSLQMACPSRSALQGRKKAVLNSPHLIYLFSSCIYCMYFYFYLLIYLYSSHFSSSVVFIPTVEKNNSAEAEIHKPEGGKSLCPKPLITRIPLFHQGSSNAGSEPEPSFKPVLCLSTHKAPAPKQKKLFVSSTKTLLGKKKKKKNELYWPGTFTHTNLL